MTSAMAWPLLALDLLGVFVFGLSGGLLVVRKRLDVLSVLILAAAAGLGGGVLRDVLIDAVPPVGLSDWRLVTAACAAGLFTCAKVAHSACQPSRPLSA